MEPARPDPRSPSGCLLIYDAECRLCVATKEHLARSPARSLRSLSFVPYQSEEARQVLGALYKEGRPEMAYFIDDGGGISQGVDAFLPFVAGVPGGRFLLRVLRTKPIKGILDQAYRLLARHRYRAFGAVRR